MTTLHLPEPDLLSVALDPDERVTLGSGLTVEPELDRVALGRPVCMRLDPATVDDEAKVFLLGRPTSAFFLLALTVSFTPNDENPLDAAWVDVTLHGQERPQGPEPVAWSMKPLTESDPVKVSTKVSLTASLKLKSEVVPIEAGPEASIGRETSYERQAVSLEALREGTSRPRWTFRSTKVTQIRGVHRLYLVIEAGTGSSGAAEVGVGATVRLRRLKLFRYSAVLDDLPELARIPLPPR